MKIGLIADTHMPGALAQLWPQVLCGFSDVDLILHAGDLHTLDVVDELCEIAPTYVARGNSDLDIVDQRLKDSWMLELVGLNIGMMHHFPSPERKSSQVIHKYLDRHFPKKPDILIFGHTHFEGIYNVDGILCINPGSPTLPRNQSTRMGTVAYLEISEQTIRAEVYQITDTGLISHESIDVMELSRKT